MAKDFCVIQCLKSVDGPHDSCSSQEKDCLAFIYCLALTRMSFGDFPLWYDRMGGSLTIFLSCGWFCIKCHFPMSISFKLGKAGMYCVTKGRIIFRAVLFLFVRDVSLSDFWEMFFYCCCWVTSILEACGKISNVFLKNSLGGICS